MEKNECWDASRRNREAVRSGELAGSGVQVMKKYSRRLVREVLHPHVSGHYEKVSFGGQGKEEELTAVERGHWITGEAMLSWECLPSENSFFFL
jgi:hypothetical protein